MHVLEYRAAFVCECVSSYEHSSAAKLPTKNNLIVIVKHRADQEKQTTVLLLANRTPLWRERERERERSGQTFKLFLSGALIRGRAEVLK